MQENNDLIFLVSSFKKKNAIWRNSWINPIQCSCTVYKCWGTWCEFLSLSLAGSLSLFHSFSCLCCFFCHFHLNFSKKWSRNLKVQGIRAAGGRTAASWHHRRKTEMSQGGLLMRHLISSHWPRTLPILKIVFPLARTYACASFSASVQVVGGNRSSVTRLPFGFTLCHSCVLSDLYCLWVSGAELYKQWTVTSNDFWSLSFQAAHCSPICSHGTNLTQHIDYMAPQQTNTQLYFQQDVSSL